MALTENWFAEMFPILISMKPSTLFFLELYGSRLSPLHSSEGIAYGTDRIDGINLLDSGDHHRKIFDSLPSFLHGVVEVNFFSRSIGTKSFQKMADFFPFQVECPTLHHPDRFILVFVQFAKVFWTRDEGDQQRHEPHSLRHRANFYQGEPILHSNLLHLDELCFHGSGSICHAHCAESFHAERFIR